MNLILIIILMLYPSDNQNQCVLFLHPSSYFFSANNATNTHKQGLRQWLEVQSLLYLLDKSAALIAS
jgi:hypothetical protein